MTRSPDELTHAGAIAVDLAGDEPRWLVVRSSRPPHGWVLPKGHIEPGESPEETAVRELREEAGVVGRVVVEVGRAAFEARGEEVRVVFFLVRAEDRVEADEDREVHWGGLDETLAMLTFENVRELLRLAGRVLHALEGLPDA